MSFIPGTSQNMAVRLLVYDGDDVAPHIQVVRASRTVPTGQVALIDGGFVRVVRKTVWTTAGVSTRAFCRIVRSAVSYPFCGVDVGENTVGAGKSLSAGSQGLIEAGDQGDLTTRDDGTGGTSNFSSYLKMTEFDRS